MKNRILLKINKGVIPVFAVFFVAFFLLYTTFSMNGVENNSYTRLSEMKVDVKHEDGTVDSFNSNMFNFQSKNDKITIHLPLDEKLRKENQSINFFFYASVVKAYYKDKLLVSYGEDVKRHMIGHLKILIPVPMEAYGDEIRVEIQPTMDFMEDTFHFPVLMPIQDALFFPILGKETSFSFFYMVLIGTFFAIAFLACQYFLQDYAKEGFWMMILINSIIAWYMGNTGMIYAVNANEDFNAIVEYIGMYMLFFSAPLFASYETVRPAVKKYLRFMGKLLFGVFALCLILYLLPTGYTFVKYLRVAQGIQIVMVFSALLSLLFPGKKAASMAEYIMQYGLIFVSLFGILEQIRIICATKITEDFPPILRWFAAAPFSRWLLYMLVLTFLSSYAFKVSNVVQKTLEEKNLKILAYTDNLSAMGNRQYLQRKLDILDKSRNRDYAVIFMDINDLKYTNDHFGHEEGDHLIRMVSSSIKKAMDNMSGFYGRNGGDEFLSVLIPANKATEVVKQINANLQKIKEEEKPVFPVSLSLGIANYREVEEERRFSGLEMISSSDVIRKADARMYEDKCVHKKKHPLVS
ncbi:GGDEF domain-containing protein [Oribacterium sp. oral taxon 108]|uniref:GGDEF domain-containing protein n=1 Tax=Oribacterium sp. oral taxon 108 TaxID=712414 RepID=UPI00020DD143|nr:GGDEF domain-containing protein [Oribacterium sp. oral taxon 108]EGL37982.1 diguanylate cyclase (GGDEF) domain protein [Oribacterium sp. oral taxon 108 str. F0425]